MSKLLIRKAKKEFLKDLGKEITISKPKTYFIKDITQDFHSADGVVAKKDLKKKDGSKVQTNTNKEFNILTAYFIDDYKRIERGAQIISLKDIGVIISYTGINKTSRAADAGSGSGALACFLANICKEVTSYEIRDDFYTIAKNNKEKLGLKNLKIKKKNVFDGIDEDELDLITLDLPDPWNALGTVEKSLKIGGFLVSYSPTIPQVMDFINIINKKERFIHLKTIELIQREWEIDQRKVRPMTTQTVHTGFLSFVRKIS